MLAIFLILSAPPDTSHLLPIAAQVSGTVAEVAVVKPVQAAKKAVEKTVDKLTPNKPATANKQQRPRAQVLVFGSEDCFPCKIFERDFKALRDCEFTWSDTDETDIHHVDEDKFPKSFKQWNVTRLPTFILVKHTETGLKEEARITGYPNKEFKTASQFCNWLHWCSSGEWEHGKLSNRREVGEPQFSTVVDVPEVVEPKNETFAESIYCRCNQKALPYYLANDGSDPVTSCHEACHFLNATLSNQHNKAAFYVGDGKAVLIEKPQIFLRQIADKIPVAKRTNQLFITYLVHSRRTNDAWGLYMFDELNAYIAGCEHAKEIGQLERFADSAKSARTIAEYCESTIEVIKERLPNYNVASLETHFQNELARLEALEAK